MDLFPTIDLKATGENIVKLRKSKGISVKELQTFFGFEQPQAIYKWQWGDCLPSVDNLFVLSKILEVPMNEILVESGQDFLFGIFVLLNKNVPLRIRSYAHFYLANNQIFMRSL